MSVSVCPECRAELSPDLVQKTGTARCPFCGANVAELLRTLPVANASDSGEASNRTVNVLRPLPEWSRIEIAESTSDRLLLYIPAAPNKRARSLGFFALLWNSIIGFVTFLAIRAAIVGAGRVQNPMPGWGPIPFFGLFWIAGLIMAYAWLRLRFEKTIVIIEENRIVIQRILFGYKRIQEWTLMNGSSASLVSSYEENKRPVYAVAVTTTTSDAKFGTTLRKVDKEWLVDTLNTFLQPEKFTVTASGEIVPRTEPLPRIFPYDLPDDSPIVVEELNTQLLRIHYPVTPRDQVSVLATMGSLLMMLVWYAILGGVLFALMHAPLKGFEWVLPGVLLGSAAALPLIVLAITWKGRITVELDPAQFQCRYHLGSIGITRRLPTTLISSVEVCIDPENSPRVRPTPHTAGRLRCVIRDREGKTIPLTLSHSVEFARTLVALLYTRLVDLGQLPPHE